MPGITKPVSRLLKLYRECTSELFKQFSNDFNPRAALQRNGGIWAGMQTAQQAALNRNQTSSPPASTARLHIAPHDAGSTSPAPASARRGQHSSATLPSSYSQILYIHTHIQALYHLSYISPATFTHWSTNHLKRVHKQQLRKARLLTSFKSLCRLLFWALQHPQRVNPVHMDVARPIPHQQ